MIEKKIDEGWGHYPGNHRNQERRGIWSCFFFIPFEPGEGVKENPGEQRRLSERSETKRVQPRPGFFERVNVPKGGFIGCPFFRHFFGQAKK
jgi:hypothetical protein